MEPKFEFNRRHFLALLGAAISGCSGLESLVGAEQSAVAKKSGDNDDSVTTYTSAGENVRQTATGQFNQIPEIRGVDLSPLEDVPDVALREAAVEMVRSIDIYQKERAKGKNENVPAIIDIYKNATEVFAYYERHQNRFGETSARIVKPTIVNLFEHAMQELRWTDAYTPTDGRIAAVYHRLEDKLNILRRPYKTSVLKLMYP